MHFEENYPNKPPQVKFISRMVLFPSPLHDFPGLLFQRCKEVADYSFIQMFMLRESCALIFCRIGGVLRMMSPLFLHRNPPASVSSFIPNLLSLPFSPCLVSLCPLLSYSCLCFLSPFACSPRGLPCFCAACFVVYFCRIRGLSISIQSLLNDPNNASPANVEAAQLHRDNVKEYVKRVRQTVEASWECDTE